MALPAASETREELLKRVEQLHRKLIARDAHVYRLHKFIEDLRNSNDSLQDLVTELRNQVSCLTSGSSISATSTLPIRMRCPALEICTVDALDAQSMKIGSIAHSTHLDTPLSEPSCAKLYLPPGLDDLNGDPVFMHPYVQGLLQTARKKVLTALGELPAEDRWLICVRTYGRAGNPEHGNWEKRRFKAGRGVLGLTLAALAKALGPAEAFSRCLLYVSHEDPDFTSGRLSASLRGTSWEDRIIVGIKGADLQARFVEESFPKNSHAIVADDNIVKFHVASQPLWALGGNRILDVAKDGGELGTLIRRAWTQMGCNKANVWSINGSYNYRVLYQAERSMQTTMQKTGLPQECCDSTLWLGLIYGACYGFRVLHDPRRYTRYGQVKDDVERSLRYWHCDGVVLRFRRYGVEKTHRPGQYNKKKGGISADSSAELHEGEKRKALTSMLREFASQFASLPKEGQAAPCGIVFHRSRSTNHSTRARGSGNEKRPIPTPLRAAGKRTAATAAMAEADSPVVTMPSIRQHSVKANANVKFRRVAKLVKGSGQSVGRHKGKEADETESSEQQMRHAKCKRRSTDIVVPDVSTSKRSNQPQQ